MANTFCNNFTAIGRPCGNNSAAIVKMYLAPSPYVSGYTASTGTVTAITMSAATKFVEYEFIKGNCFFTEDIANNYQNGTTTYTYNINLNLAKRQASLREAIKLVANGVPDITMILKDGNGKYWGFGLDDDKVNFNSSTGGIEADKQNGFNGYRIKFDYISGDGAYEISSSIISNLIA